MKETSLEKKKKTVDKQEKKITELQELVRVRKEKYRLLQEKYKYLEKNMEQTIEREINTRCKKLEEENDSLKEEIAKLKSLLNTDSNNSGIPTSQTPIDKKKRIPNSRKKSEKSIGGQRNHKKHKLEKFKEEELTDGYYYEIDKCPCGGELNEIGVREKDELDIEVRVKKIRHYFKEYKCKCCGREIKVPIPKHLKEENQYGNNVKALALSLVNEGFVSYHRTRELIRGFSSEEIDISEGYLVKLQQEASKKLENFIKELKRRILKEDIIHWDDTVIMINTNRACLRFYGTENLALYTAHEKKDKDGIDEDQILNLLGKDTIVVHDHNTVNYNNDYDFQNAECCVHLIRDLEKIKENLNRKWAQELIELLVETNKTRTEYIEHGDKCFEEEFIEEVQVKYDEILEIAKEDNRKDFNPYFGKDEKALINRLSNYKNNYLMWIIRFEVPFSNNLSERSLRSSKTKMKVSGQFKNILNAQYYSNIKSYIETCKRNDINIHEALVRLLENNPYSINEILNNEKNSE